MRLLIFVFLSSDPFHLSPPFEYNERLDQTYVYIQKSCFLLLIELYVSYLKYFDNFKKLHARIFVQNYRIYQYPPLSSFIVNYLVNCIKMSKIFVRFLFVTNNFSLMSSHKYKDTIEKIPLKNTSSLVKTKKARYIPGHDNPEKRTGLYKVLWFNRGSRTLEALDVFGRLYRAPETFINHDDDVGNFYDRRLLKPPSTSPLGSIHRELLETSSQFPAHPSLPSSPLQIVCLPSIPTSR